MVKERKIVVITTYNELGTIIDTKAKPLIQCRDCESYHPELYQSCQCERFGIPVEASDYCSKGEQRDE